MHAGAADGFDDVEHPFTVDEHVEHGRQLPHVLREGAIEQQVAGDAEQLAQHHADDLHAFGHHDARHLLQRHDIGQVVHHAAQIVDAVGIGNEGVPGLPLTHLLGAAVVVADVRHGVHKDLAIQLQRNAEHAVHAGVIGPEIQKHEFGVPRLAGHAPFFRVEAQGLLLHLLPLLGKRIGLHLCGPRRVVLAQRVTLPGRGQHDAGEIGVA